MPSKSSISSSSSKSEQQFSFDVSEEQAGQRIDKLISLELVRIAPHWTRSQLKSLFEQELVLIDGEVAAPSHKAKEGEKITVSLRTADILRPILELNPRPAPLNILYEDDDILVVDKEAGMVVHPGSGETGITLVEALMARGVQLAAADGADPQSHLRPGIVHRLDKGTAGVMVVAKNLLSHQNLSKQFAEKTNLREYQAVVKGRFHKRQIRVGNFLVRSEKDPTRFEVSRAVVNPDDKPEGKYAETLIQVESEWPKDGLSLLRIQLLTGRTHQIRVHCESLDHPIFGDDVYRGHSDLPSLRGVSPRMKDFERRIEFPMLHAKILGFDHPRTGEKIAFESDQPKHFTDCLSLLTGE